VQGSPHPVMKRQSQTRPHSILIPLLICICLVILSIGVWKHVRKSEQPPLYDAITYVAKAKAFWDMFASGHWTNPLDLQPVPRPPGTILMSYPFGFSEGYKGFLARSILLPVFLFVAALYIAASRARMSAAEHLDFAAVALVLASLPCFYHFEAADGINSPTYWGLVDSFLAAMAALAFATGYRAVQNGSWLLLALSSLLTGLCLMIKPAGVIVAMVIVILLVIIKIVNDINRPGGRLFPLQLLRFVIVLSAGTGLLLVAAIKSRYLSHETFQWGNQAMTILRTEFKFAPSLENLNTVLHPAFGLNVIVLLVAATIAAIRVCVDGARTRDLRNTSIALLNFALTSIVLAVGAFFWLVYADLSQVRYYYPFAFVSLILLGIFLLNSIRKGRVPFTRSLLYGSAAILFGTLTTMLYVAHADTSWQQTYGVNLTSLPHREEKSIADLLLQRARTARHDVKVYAMDLGWDFGAIASDGIAAKILRADEPAFGVSFPVDWQRPSTVHLKDVVASDYILFHTVADESKKRSLLTGRDTGTLSAEIATIGAWLMGANEESGLRQLTTGTRTLKQVVDRDLFAQSIAKWTKAIDWRDVFTKENADFLKDREMSSAPDSTRLLIQ
jgi:hypothetical protein